jgi:8-oxo-dGTP pyrophosphatase MutT (NUDIX family)
VIGLPGAALHEELGRVLTGYEDADAGQRAIRQAMLAYLDARPDALQRSCVPGHFTASTLVVDPSREAVLLTLHPRVGKWLQLGGHFEDDESIVDAALREAVEEGGIADLKLDPQVLNLDVHPVTCSLGVPTRHLDVRFLAIAPPGAEPTISDESLDLRWFHRDRLPDPLGIGVPAQIRRAFDRLR